MKQTVGTRITFLSRQRKEQDPWEESDPWSQALSSKDPKPSGKTQLVPPQIALIPQVWENEDKTTPSVIERPTRGSTGLAIMSPQSFVDTWSSTATPASPDELTVVVWPPTHDEVINIPHETVIFPARVVQGSSVTLLKGVAYHLGAKRINLKHEETNEFKTKQAVSLMVELERNLLDSTTWTQLVNEPVEHVQLTLGKQIPLLSSWGTRYWDSQDKIASPKDCHRVTTNVLISPEHLQTVLKISGTNIWISPRSGQTVFQHYRPIWVRGNLTEVRRQHDVLEHAAGIIKGKRGFAARVPTEKLEEAKQRLYPGQMVQPSLDPTGQVCLYKVSPTNFLNKTLRHYTVQVRKQVGPTSWLIAVNNKIQEDFISTNQGYLILQEWRSGKNQSSFRHAVVVGNPRVLKQATETIGSIPQRVVAENPEAQTSTARPPPQGPVQQMLQETNKETEEKLMAIIQGNKRDTEDQIRALRQQLDETKSSNNAAIDELKQQQQHHQQSLERVERATKTQAQSIEKQMSDQFAALFKELRGMKGTPEGKRSPAPSPDGEPNKAAKTS